VVNAAGYYAQRVGEWFKPFGGRTVPMMVMSHQYMLFRRGAAVATGRRRWVTSCRCCATWTVSYYLRQEKNGFNLGPYERNCKAHWADPTDPDARGFQLSALSRRSRAAVEWYIEDAMARVPLLAEAGLAKTSTARSPMRPTATR
jgi:dimethylglycine dehydrogenase